MNLNFLIKKNHIFKRRVKNFYSLIKTSEQTGLFSTNKIRFEFVYLKTFKKIFRKKYFKKKPQYMLTKFWLMIKPNFILSMKSKNSRMGSGVGNYVRVASIVKPNKPIILFKKYSIFFLKNTIKYIKLKLNIKLQLLIKK